MNTKRNLPLIILCYAAIYLIWGSTYFFIALAVETISPAWIVFTRFTLAGLFLVLFPILTGKVKSLPSKKEILTSIFLGFFLLIMGNGVVTIAEKNVDSYIASLIISTVPLLVTIMNWLIYRTKITASQILGFFVGFAGVAFLLYSDKPRHGAEILSISLLFLAIFCWSFGTTWSKKLTHHSNTFFSTGVQMLTAGVISFGVIIFQGESLGEALSNASELSIISVLFLTVVGGSAIGAYNYLLKNEPTNRITSYALVNPLIATVLGIVIGGETPSKFLIPGIVLIISGLTIMLYLKKK